MNTKVVIIIHHNYCFSLSQNNEIVLIVFEFSTWNTVGQATVSQFNSLQIGKNNFQAPECMKSY